MVDLYNAKAEVSLLGPIRQEVTKADAVSGFLSSRVDI